MERDVGFAQPSQVEVMELGGTQVSRFGREFQPETRVSILQGQVPLTFKASNSCRAWPNQAPCSWASSRCTLPRSTCCAWATSVSTWAVASACSCRSSSSSCWADSGVSEWQLLCLPRTCLVLSLRVLHLGTLFCWAKLGHWTPYTLILLRMPPPTMPGCPTHLHLQQACAKFLSCVPALADL